MTDYKSVMLTSPNAIKGSGDLNINVDDSVIGASIRAAQEIYIRDVIGDALLDHIKELVYNKIAGNDNTIDDEENAAYKTLLDDHIKDCLNYKTVSEICIRISLKIRNIGVAQNSDTNINASSSKDIKYLRSTYDTYYCDSLNRMIDFLRKNKAAFSELGDTFCVCGERKPNLDNKYGNTGLWLGK